MRLHWKWPLAWDKLLKFFPAAKQVLDRFHIQQLVFKAIYEIRIKTQWEAMGKENIEIAYDKSCDRAYCPKVFYIDDTRKQLLANPQLYGLILNNPSKSDRL